MRVAAFLLLASLLMMPVAAAAPTATILLEMSSPSKFVMQATAKVSGEEASELRMGMDQFGNQDGQVQPAEVEAMENFFLSFMDRDDDGGDSTLGSSFTVDGKSPKDLSFSEFDIRNAEGATSSQSEITIFLKGETTFDVVAGDSHTIRIVGEESDEEDDSGNEFFDQLESAKFRAAPGYIFSETTGLPTGARVSGDKKEINFDNTFTPATGDTVIVMTKGGPAGGNAPGPGFAILLAAVALVGLALRRR